MDDTWTMLDNRSMCSLDNPKPSRTPGSCVSQHEPCKLSAGRESLPCCHSTLCTVEKKNGSMA